MASPRNDGEWMARAIVALEASGDVDAVTFGRGRKLAPVKQSDRYIEIRTAYNVLRKKFGVPKAEAIHLLCVHFNLNPDDAWTTRVMDGSNSADNRTADKEFWRIVANGDDAQNLYDTIRRTNGFQN